jgi:hypothetical protein
MKSKKSKYIKIWVQVMILILIVTCYPIQPVIIQWFKFGYFMSIDFPLNWFLIFLLSVLFLFVTFED